MNKKNLVPAGASRRAVGVAILTCLGCGFTMINKTNAEDMKIGLSEKDYLGPLPTVLSATRLSQPLPEAPAAITVVDRDMIRASGARELADVFRLVPGFQVGYVSGHWQTVTYHGLADTYSKRMQVLVDGRSVYTPAFGGVQWSDLPLALDDIDRIEVIRGPNMASYGANAVQGVINIITRHAAQDSGTQVKAMGGSKGVREGYLRHGGAMGNLDYRFTLGHRQDDGFDNRNDSKRVSLATLRTDYRATPNDTLMLQLGLNEGPRGMGEPATPDNPTPTDNEHGRRINSNYQQIRWQHSKGSDEEISLQFFHNYHKSSESWLTPGLPILGGAQLPMDASVTAQRYDLELQHNFAPSNQWRFVWGASTRLDQVTSPGYLGTQQALSHRLYRLFANGEWRITPAWLLNAGAMMEKNDITGVDLAPRLALNHLINANHALRASLSKAMRTPVIFEDRADTKITSGSLLNHLYLGNRDLLPETIVSRELGYLGTFPQAHLSMDARFFHDRISRLIDTSLVPYPADNVGDRKTRQFMNGDTATVTGAETQIKYRPRKGTQLIFSYAYMDMDSGDQRIKYSRTAPVNSLSLLAMHDFGYRVQGSLGYYYADQVYYIDLPKKNIAAEMQRLDLRLAHLFKRGEIAVVAQNVLGDYQEYRRQNGFDTRWYATLTLSLQ